ncbi:S41 family peptidase [Streptomyces aidingensis]|uniref:Tricorn protease homolog n=1 Tax=Streptomyces aidingensis TaxID=910347 RepID=A0A1I1GX45_9ACTN|nr:S41 family peptidase [Streptomyces aidingensis]SFC16056.1 tricorn protease [Streptomyces aidingensis]
MGGVSESATDDRGYLRFPHLHGDRLCFVAEDDLWLAPLPGPGARDGGGRAWRLTVDRTRCATPRFSPDGTRIAFTSWRTLDPEIHLVPAGGGPARQLSHWVSTDTRVRGWADHRRVLAVSSHTQPFSHRTWAHAVPVDGAPGEKLPWGPVADIAVTGNGGGRRTLLLSHKAPHEPASWKRYRGGAMGRLWLHGERLLPDLEGHLDCPMFVAGRIAFLSDHEGVANLYSCAPDGGDLRRHTDHDAFYARHAATDGRRVVYQCAGELWLVEDLAPGGVPRRLGITLGGARSGRRPYQVPVASNVDGVAVDTTGRASAVCVRGALYWLTHRDGPSRVITATAGVRVRLPVMLGGTGRVAYVTDAAGEDAIEVSYLPRAGGGRDPVRAAAGRLGRVLELAAAPDGETVAVAGEDGRLLLVPVPDPDTPGEAAGAGAGITEVIRSLNGPVRDVAFSPDGQWLAWAHPGTGRSLTQIKIARLNGDEATILDVTDGRFEDEEPCFTQDGRYLAFLSWRGFDPVYDVHTGDLSFPMGCRPYLVPLSSATPSPFAHTPEGRPAAGGLDPAEAPPGDGSVLVEADGLGSRVTPFPVPASKYSGLRPVSGCGLVWLRWPISGVLGQTFANPEDTSPGPTLVHFDIPRGKSTELTRDVDWFSLSGDAARMVIADSGDLRAVPATELPDSETTVHIDLRRIVHHADPAAEWRQSFEEAGRLIRAYFWEPEMCGVDWKAVLDQYRPLVERVATPDEFADLLRETLGELGTSHAYVVPARRNEGPPHYQRAMGLLGADFLPDRESGSWRLARVLPGDSSDPRARSPLAGMGLPEGSVLTHVDGRPVDPVAGPWPLLAGTGGSTVELTFVEPLPAANAANAAPPEEPAPRPRRIAVSPLIDDRPLRYQDWVTLRRETVHRLGGGRCGYVHIPDMGGSGWAQFTRDLRREFSRQALIVDVRGNAGGNISELVVEKLTRTILGWDLTRNAQPVSYASNAPRGPVVAVTDEATASDGDMITAAFKLLGLGPVIGCRTWGGVVGMTGRHRLGDGTVITVPMNAAWFEGYGWEVENRGVEPDVEAVRSPLDWAEGRNVVLEAAVRMALELLADSPAASPPDLSGVPDRRRPPLPPRG